MVRLIFGVLLLTISIYAASASSVENRTVGVDDDIGILRSYMYMEVHPPSSKEWLRVKCWSGSNNNNRDSGQTYSSQTLSWDFNSGASTKFWCQAQRQNGQIIPTFPVFGDGVPKKSSRWRVNASGKIRVSEDNKSRGDYIGPWQGTPITTTTTTKATTTTKPTTTTTPTTTTPTTTTPTTTTPTTTTPTTTTPTTTTPTTTTPTTTTPTTTTPTTTEPPMESCPMDDPTELPTTCPPNDYNATYLQYPYNCRRFFQCWNGTAFCMQCPSGTVWNDTLKICDSEHWTECVIGTTTPTPTDPPPTNQTTTEPSTTTRNTRRTTTNPPRETTTKPTNKLKKEITVWKWKLRYFGAKKR